jgi:hypothetical protein
MPESPKSSIIGKLALITDAFCDPWERSKKYRSTRICIMTVFTDDGDCAESVPTAGDDEEHGQTDAEP